MDLDGSPVSTHMETEAQEYGDDGGMEHARSGGSFSQLQNSDALIGGINDNNNAETVTWGQTDTQLRQPPKMERFDLEFNAPTIKPNNKDVSVRL